MIKIARGRLRELDNEDVVEEEGEASCLLLGLVDSESRSADVGSNFSIQTAPARPTWYYRRALSGPAPGLASGKLPPKTKVLTNRTGHVPGA
mmetsp:Transcript_16559/g.33886  ORF Transcript_16559/g.33886 Transcript_16559/m.33886 type:complete len:92 (-) Transcript_16559:612-887(-)